MSKQLTRRSLGLGVVLCVALGAGAPSARQVARTPAPAQQIDQDYTKRILDNTPDKRILTELVDHMVTSATVPSPLKFLGYVPGENNRVTYHADIVRYLQALDKASDRVTMWTIGKSDEGRDMVSVAIADEATIKQLDKYKQITAQLTDPRKLTDAQARTLIQTGKPIYYASGSIHSTEVGSPEMLMELAFRMAVEETPFIQQIRNNMIFVFTPVSEVDGRERAVDNRRAPEEGQPAPGMVYWGKYVAHDNNRDGIGKGLTLTRNMLKSFLDLHPQVLHDLHESVNLLYVSTGHGPYNPIVAPIQVNEWWWLAQTEIMEMTKRNVPGVWTFDYYDGWVPNYMFWIGVTHNSIGRFYETQSYGGGGGRGGAAPAGAGRAGAPIAGAAAAGRAGAPVGGAAGAAPQVAADGRGAAAQAPVDGGPQAPAAGRGGRGGAINANSREWYRPNPSPGDVVWSGRANINMQQSALLIALNSVAKNREMFLENYYIKNKQMVEQGRTKAPFAYIVPARQRHRVEAADLMNLIRFEGAEVHTATSAFTAGTVNVEPGDYVVRMDQPYGGVVETLLGVQWYPADNPNPYDDTGWFIPGLRNLKSFRVDDKTILDKPMALASADFKIAGTITGTGSTIVIDHTTDNTLMTFRFQNRDVKMSAAEQPFDLGGHRFSAGAFVIQNANRASLEPQLREFGLSAWATATPPSVPMHDMDVPRIGYIHSWGSTQDEGWVRLALDKLKVPYTYFGENLVRQGGLRAKYDVILYPHAQVQADSTGMPPGAPTPYKGTPLTPNIATAPDQSDDTRGGLGNDGLRELVKFVAEGGVVITEGATSTLFPRYQLTTGITVDRPANFWTQGSVLKTVLGDKSSPILYGYDQSTLAVMYASSPIFGLGTPSATPAPVAGGGRGGGGRGGGTPDGVGGGNTQPMAAAPRLTTLDGPPPAAAAAGPGGGRGAGFGGAGGGRGGAGGRGAGGADAGAPAAAPAMGSAAFGVPAASAPRVLLSYPTDGNDILLSGGLVGGEAIAGRPVLVDSAIGNGHVVMFTNRPFWRYETQGNFFLAFNAILNWNDLSTK